MTSLPPSPPGIESRLDAGFGIVAMPMRPTYKPESRLESPEFTGARAEYSSAFVRARWMVPFETRTFTVSGGFSLALYPGNASLSLSASKGPDGRYLSQYAFLTRAEFEFGDIVASAGLAMTMNKMDYVEISIESIEPQLDFEMRGTFKDWSLFLDSLSPELQLGLRAAPFAASYRLREKNTLAPSGDTDAPFKVSTRGKSTVYAGEAAIGIHVTPELERRKRFVREAVVVVGALLEKRSFEDFVLKVDEQGNTTRHSDGTGQVVAFFLSIQGFLP